LSIFPSKYKKEFTRAEVLVTLTIIGVVSAMTVPTLVTNAQEYTFRAGFLKNYSIIKSAYRLAEQSGDVLHDGQNAYSIDYNKLEDYFKVEKKEKYAQNACLSRIYNNINISKSLKYLNGKTFAQNGYELTVNLVVPYAFQLKDSTIVAPMVSHGFERNIFLVDINGLKNPNTVGKDIYFLQYTNRAIDNYWREVEYSMEPYGSPATGNVWNNAPHSKTHDCRKSQLGMTCAYEIVKNKNFKIPKD